MLGASIHRAWSLWASLQVSRQGFYSIERLLALEQYSNQTSRWRLACVGALSPLLSLGLILWLQWLPLKTPSQSTLWIDWAWWVRVFVTAGGLTFALLIQLQTYAPQLQLTLVERVGIAIGETCGFASFVAVVGSFWVFPIPFTIALSAFPQVLLFFTLVQWIIGSRRLGLERTRLRLFTALFMIQVSLVLIYTAFGTLIAAAQSSRYQSFLVMLLPIVKLIMKNAVAHFCKHFEDIAPVTIVFSVEFFDALYTNVCMQNAGSWLTTSLVSVVYVLQSSVTLFMLSQRISTVQSMLRYHELAIRKDCQLIPMVISLCFSPEPSSRAQFSLIRLQASHPQRITIDCMAKLLALEALDVYDHSAERRSQIIAVNSTNKTTDSTTPNARFSNIQVFPLPEAEEPTVETKAEKTTSPALLLAIFQLTYQCEYLVLSQYVQSITTASWAVQHTQLMHIPNARFFPSSLVGETLPWTMGIYPALVLGSALALHYILRSRLRLSAPSMLGFVLETQTQLVQSHLVFWTLVLAQFSLQHFGVDFTLQFEWMRGKT